ncbi:MAG: hypothetical protein LBI80_03860, partial [Endomicrobium sp.]|nr:hypothetical protein [Endomicrobium sp.]
NINNTKGNLGHVAFGGGSSIGGAFSDNGQAWTFGSGNASQYYIKNVSFDLGINNTANENRPINYAVQYCIKY